MEHTHTDLQPPGLQPEYTARLNGLIEDYLASDSEPFFYDANVWDDEEARNFEAGIQRHIPIEKLHADESVSVTSFNEAGRMQMRKVILEKFGQDVQPIMHVELVKGDEHIGFSATVYILDTGDIAVWSEWNIVPDNPLSDESKKCYEFAREIGLGDTWVQAMFESESEGLPRGESLAYMDAPGADRFVTFLNTCMNGV